MDAKSIARVFSELSEVTICRYLDELLASGHLLKVSIAGKRKKGIRAYGYVSQYGGKTDMVSRALSHPLHQLTLAFVLKQRALHEIDRVKCVRADKSN